MADAPGSNNAAPAAPARMADLGSGGNQGAPAGTQPARMTDLGIGGSQTAAPKMVPLTVEQIRQAVNEPPPDPNAPPEPVDPNEPPEPVDPNAEPADPNTPLTPEQQAAKYQEWIDSDQIPEEFLDRPIWVPDGKDGHVPIRLRDIQNNVLLYNDYQKKTTEVAQQRRFNESVEQGRQRWVADMTSSDPEKGLRAIRAVGAEKTLESIVVRFVQNMAKLEGMDPDLRQQFMEGQQARDKAYFLEQQLEARRQQDLQAQQQEQQNAGLDSPDIRYVQDSIMQQMPSIYKQLNVQESPMIDHLLSGMLAAAAEGVRDPRTGQWITPPAIQLGRAPSRELLTQLLLAAKQKADTYVVSHGRGLKPPPTQPLRGSGPAAQPGQRGNIGAQPPSRFSDLATGRRSG